MSLYHELLEALNPLITALNENKISYYIGGSVSSSIHGLARSTQDIDVILDLQPYQVHVIARRLKNEYYLDEQAWRDAILHNQPYSILHLATMMKVDVIPLKQRAFTREEARRAQPRILEAGTPPVNIASAEDTILTKLEWFEMGGRSSGRQWNDILGIIRQQGKLLDLSYLRHWADILGVRELFENALHEA
jgi:hypothetical protein